MKFISNFANFFPYYNHFEFRSNVSKDNVNIKNSRSPYFSMELNHLTSETVHVFSGDFPFS